MLKFFSMLSLIMVCLFMLTACFGSSSVETGLNPAELIEIDDDYSTVVTLERGEILAVDMPNPLVKGYRISGASFDPSMLRMERFLEYSEDDENRARYLFTVLMDGSSDILIKMKPLQGGTEEVYRQVTIGTGESEGLF
ncbi:hypothetical protein SYK_09800 [Pseudodesulfovibrio nedwellii]|uniref:Lipoprotein n=1 Tax=Pseudodesulfovibrio nedwellii TaxID=2973072 RepID=A0ABN6S2P2_9BACT|nr:MULTISPECIES: hypothetical protein [Pseudodesulfovibrio]BDQ36620.1 hypothetical protein SYK_09800 [Pseudodesulfovibrio nedwellii]